MRLRRSVIASSRETELVAVDPGERGYDIYRCMRDQRCMVIGEQSALILEEIQQIGHLFEVRRHIWVVAAEVDIIELDIDDVLDAIAETALRLSRLGGSRPAGRGRRQNRDRNKTHPFHLPRSPIRSCGTARRGAGCGT